MDRFFGQYCCDRCKGPLTDGVIKSMYNEEIICMKCKKKEMQRYDYKRVVYERIKKIRAGNKN